MWYETIPSMAIILGALYLPQAASWYFNEAVFGLPFRRKQVNDYQFRMFRRDTEIYGAPWKVKGLENIDDL